MSEQSLQPGRLERIIQMQSLIVQAEFKLDSFMQLVVDNLQELSHAMGAVVELVDGEDMVYKAVSGLMTPYLGTKLAQSASLSGLCVRSGQVLRCVDADTDPRVDLQACRRVGVKSMVCTPLLQGGAPIGVLKVMSSLPDAFNEDDVQTLRLMADVLGSALGKQVAFDRLRKTEEQLRASEAFLDRTGRLACVGGWELHPASGTLIWSDQTRRLHEVPLDWQPTLEEAINFYDPDEQLRIRAAVEEAMTHGTPWNMELSMRTAKGRAIWVHTFGEIERRPDGSIHLVGAIQDITEHRLRKEELQREQQLRNRIEDHVRETQALLAERSEMLNVMAHEVRQPLNNASAALQSAAGILADVKESAAAQRLSRARGVMGQVLSSIDNTLAVAALLARPAPAERTDADIDTLINVTLADLAEDQRPRIHIERTTPTRTATMDMSLMRLALRNLLSNALKFSPISSPVILRVSDCDQPLALLLDVIDQGPGIPADLVPRLFQRGARDESSGHPAGQGLGLYIVRRVMELHGGQVTLQHNTNAGVTMRLVLTQAPDD
ncbi:MAG: GAF domain-containing protein [Burkholderiales bacterium]|jgi:signal transduction histidine kinase|nr:MAG: GAF domain-containing protein [Burkholderiales bacterium]